MSLFQWRRELGIAVALVFSVSSVAPANVHSEIWSGHSRTAYQKLNEQLSAARTVGGMIRLVRKEQGPAAADWLEKAVQREKVPLSTPLPACEARADGLQCGKFKLERRGPEALAINGRVWKADGQATAVENIEMFWNHFIDSAPKTRAELLQRWMMGAEAQANPVGGLVIITVLGVGVLSFMLNSVYCAVRDSMKGRYQVKCEDGKVQIASCFGEKAATASDLVTWVEKNRDFKECMVDKFGTSALKRDGPSICKNEESAKDIAKCLDETPLPGSWEAGSGGGSSAPASGGHK